MLGANIAHPIIGYFFSVVGEHFDQLSSEIKVKELS
jgi:hypothetical protein